LVSSQQESKEEEAQLERSLAASQIKFNNVKLGKLRDYYKEISKAIGMPPKEKEKHLKNLEQEIFRL